MAHPSIKADADVCSKKKYMHIINKQILAFLLKLVAKTIGRLCNISYTYLVMEVYLYLYTLQLACYFNE